MRSVTTTLLGLGLAATLPLAANAQHLVYGSFVPGTDFINTHTLPEAFEMISEATDGKVSWDLIVGGQLADGVGTFSAVEDRLMDGGLISPFFSPSTLPSLAFLYSVVVPTEDVVALTGAVTETLFLNCPQCLADSAKMNSIPFGPYAAPPTLLMCTKPVATLDDLRGMRVRAIGGIGDMINESGATQVSMTLAESVTMLQRGGIDCAVGAADWLVTYGYGEKAKFVTAEPLGTYAPVIGLQMNHDAWAEMSETGKTATLRASAYISARHAISNFVVKNGEVLEDQIANNGVAMVETADDLRDFIRAFPDGNRPARVAAGETLGVQDPGALMDAYAKNLEKWLTLSPEIGTDVDKFTEALWAEVYSKLDPGAL
ncbi:MAG: C4-dicarboxylate ABC transporter substrate-binding protein [Qingshengfaniella sp.]